MHFTRFALLILVIGLLHGGASASASELSFSQAKKALSAIYRKVSHPSSFYCGCDIHFSGKKPLPVLSTCGYKVRKQARRASRIEWEHVVSAWEFGHQRTCWQQGGRKHCAKNDDSFKLFEGDMHNLFPTIGEVNGDRSNYRFGIVTSSSYVSYGQCPMKIDFKQRLAEPPATVRGTIARVYFYMEQKHGLKISDRQRRLFNAWNRQFAPSETECRIHQFIVDRQGDSNPFIQDLCRPDITL